MLLRWQRRLFPTSAPHKKASKQLSIDKTSQWKAENTEVRLKHTPLSRIWRRTALKVGKRNSYTPTTSPLLQASTVLHWELAQAHSFSRRIKRAQGDIQLPQHYKTLLRRLSRVAPDRDQEANCGAWPLKIKLRQKSRWSLQQAMLVSWQNTFLLAVMLW